MTVRRIALVISLTLSLPLGAEAAEAESPVPKAEAPAAGASIGNAVARGLTMKVAATAVKMSILYAGTGDLLASGAMTVFSGLGATGIYVANEYLWETFDPQVRAHEAGEQYDASASALRTTYKMLTLKPAMMGMGWGMMYAWTGSFTTAATYGGALFFAMPAAFYANTMAWDWYDWHRAQLPE